MDAVEAFIQWCRDQKEQAERSLDLMERGVLKLRSNDQDITDAHIQILKRIIDDMDAMIFTHEHPDQDKA